MELQLLIDKCNNNFKTLISEILICYLMILIQLNQEEIV